jgi:patatin-like phospholipase/acyl hydrolase
VAADQSQPTDRFRILCVDGGGIRGLIPALVLAELERRIQAEAGPQARASDYFQMFAGTSTGGLVALSLTAPDADNRERPAVSAAELAGFYTEDGPKIFHRSLWQRLRTLGGWLGPKYTLSALEEAIEHRLGTTHLRHALRELIVTSYDMTNREPYFFKRWRAREAPESDRNRPIADAGLATSAAPTYFPSHELDGRALVDGGVFAANPVIVAIVEALKRFGDDPHHLDQDDLLVVSIGTGLHEDGYPQEKVRRWGKLGWVLPQKGEPPILAATLGGAADGADHWAHTLLNHPDDPHIHAADLGHGPRYFRLQVPLTESVAMDDARERTLTETLPAIAEELIRTHEAELSEITDRLLRAGPLPHDPAPPEP